MREDPGFDTDMIVAGLKAGYGLAVDGIRYLPIGFDLNATVYEVIAEGGARSFLKIRFGPVHEPGLLVPRALADLGIAQVPAPIPAVTGQLWWPRAGTPGHTAVLYPFIQGENAMVTGLTADQWREFGTTLRAVHDSGLETRIRGIVPVEDFSLPSAALVREMLALTRTAREWTGVAVDFATFWRKQSARIEAMLARAEALGVALQRASFELVLCHTDIHAANIMVGDDGRIHLIDWDGPKLAPRERDLLFVIGSRIARTVQPEEERWFFEGYGAVPVDPDALVYYRYERIVEDLGEFGKSALLDPDIGEALRLEQVERAKGFFAPGGDIDRAEPVASARLPEG